MESAFAGPCVGGLRTEHVAAVPRRMRSPPRREAHVPARRDHNVATLRCSLGDEGCNRGRWDRSSDYSANLGKVIERLRADYPVILQREPLMDVYTDNIILKHHSNYRIIGKSSYQSFFWALRFHAKLFFRYCDVEIIRIYPHDERNELHVRWMVSGMLRMPAAFRDATRPGWIHEGVSVYKLNRRGFVYEHDIENIIRSRPHAEAARIAMDRVVCLSMARSEVPASALRVAKMKSRLTRELTTAG